MPELPEVETTCRGIAKHIRHKTVQKVIVRQPKLRWHIPAALEQDLIQQTILNVSRRGKYILLHTQIGTVIIHLGMSGSLRVLASQTPNAKHDHVDFIFTDQSCLRYTDPRRFGSIHWTTANPLKHPLLESLGPEPLSKRFTGDHLYDVSRKRSVAVKTFIMNSKIVVGVGNIYANEALFLAGISPLKPANTLTKKQYQSVSEAIKQVLTKAIKAGGTTLKDFYGTDGQPGYFKQALLVYGRNDQPCQNCQRTIQKVIINQRASYYCPHCQR